MTATIIDGKAAAAAVTERARIEAARLVDETGVRPGLAVIIVGEDPASQIYVANKARTAEACGFVSVRHRLDVSVSQAGLLALIDGLNRDPAIHGILVQLPLPAHIDDNAVIQTIDPAKDVDGFSWINVGRLGTGDLAQAFLPCTPAGCMVLLRSVHGADLSGRHAVVIGRSNIVGKPMANLLLQANATVTIAHSRTSDLPALSRMADILVAAVGRPELVRGGWLKPGATVIDVGINRIDAPERGDGKTRLVGDVCMPEAMEIAGAITPVPGGVGPMTIAMLMANTLTAACRSAGVTPPAF